MTAELIARLESADGPDRELFEAALSVAMPRPEIDWLEWSQDRIEKRRLEDRAAFQTWLKWDRNCQKFRGFLDAKAWLSAAEMLVPEGWHMSVNTTVGALLKGSAAVRDRDGGPSFASAASTPALALAAAALKARGV